MMLLKPSLTATCTATGQAEGWITPRLDTDIVIRFLAQLPKTLELAVQAVLVWDQVGGHRVIACVAVGCYGVGSPH